HYNRKESFVIDGYTEIPLDKYPAFSQQWIQQAERVLKPGGSLYIVSGYTNLIHILNALHKTSLIEMNHLIWKYNFGDYTRQKYIHILNALHTTSHLEMIHLIWKYNFVV